MSATKMMVIILAVTMALMTGCLSYTGGGILVTSLNEGVTATASPDVESVGEACSTNVLGLVSVGDSSIEEAKKNGDIAVVSSVDRSYFSVLLLFNKACTIVRGK